VSTRLHDLRGMEAAFPEAMVIGYAALAPATPNHEKTATSPQQR
jgi:hypothetical protein